MSFKTLTFSALLAVPLLVLYEVIGRQVEGMTIHVLRLLITMGWFMIANSLNSRWQTNARRQQETQLQRD